MAQHDIDIANGSGAAVRADLNLGLTAFATSHSGNNPPSPTFPYQDWADTTTNTLKKRNGANSAWILIGSLDVANMGLATLASPTLTGSPTSVTPTSTDSSTKIATTAMVQAAAALKVAAHTTVHSVVNGTNVESTLHINNGAPSGTTSNGDIWFEY
jgi:hypothetical protein